MGFATDYLAIIDAVKAKLVELKTAGALSEVHFGPRSKLGPYPVAYVVPAPYDVAQEERIEHHPIRVTVVVVGRDADMEAGLRANIVLAAAGREMERTAAQLVPVRTGALKQSIYRLLFKTKISASQYGSIDEKKRYPEGA